MDIWRDILLLHKLILLCMEAVTGKLKQGANEASSQLEEGRFWNTRVGCVHPILQSCSPYFWLRFFGPFILPNLPLICILAYVLYTFTTTILFIGLIAAINFISFGGLLMRCYILHFDLLHLCVLEQKGRVKFYFIFDNKCTVKWKQTFPFFSNKGSQPVPACF